MPQPRSFLSSILIGVELPDADPLPSALVDLLASLRVVLVGWYGVPDQTLPAQARDSFEDEAQAALATIASPFEDASGELDTFLVFTHDPYQTMSRISTEQQCDAVLIPAEMEHLHRILVPLRGVQNAPHIARFVADLVQDGTTDVTLLHVLEDDEEREAVREDVLGVVSRMMADAGIDAGLVRRRVEVADDPGEAILDAAQQYDAVVIGETEPSVKEVLFGSISETIAQTADVPVLVVRNTGEPDEDLYRRSADVVS